MFVTPIHFHSSIIFVDKARSLPSQWSSIMSSTTTYWTSVEVNVSFKNASLLRLQCMPLGSLPSWGIFFFFHFQISDSNLRLENFMTAKPQNSSQVLGATPLRQSVILSTHQETYFIIQANSLSLSSRAQLGNGQGLGKVPLKARESFRAIRRMEKNSPKFLKKQPKQLPKQKSQSIFMKGQYKSSKYLHQTPPELSKYLQQATFLPKICLGH